MFTRRTLAIETPAGKGEVALIDFGDPSRPVDVVFSHANGFNALSHRMALEPLADRLRIVAIDQRGHGRTRLPADPEGRESWFSLADDLAAVTRALGLLQPAVFAGHSMGGSISLMAAKNLGPLCRSLVLFDPVIAPEMLPADAPRPENLKSLAEMTLRRRDRFESKEAALAAYEGRGIFRTWPREALADYVEDGLVPDPDGGVRLACAPAWEASNFLAQAQPMKAMLLAADRPVRVLRAETHSTCHVLPGEAANPLVTVEIVPGSTHMLPIERPELVREALLAAVQA